MINYGLYLLHAHGRAALIITVANLPVYEHIANCGLDEPFPLPQLVDVEHALQEGGVVCQHQAIHAVQLREASMVLRICRVGWCGGGEL